ncbi:MAG: glucose sorbosone dehydrogenase [Methanobacteriota archaeon]|nr:MAG: glucose sorbosone dehydrogenase [Euryarchaeota archaeon]
MDRKWKLGLATILAIMLISAGIVVILIQKTDTLENESYRLSRAFTHDFENPVEIVHHGDAYYILEQKGRVLMVKEGNFPINQTPIVALDISTKVDFGGEKGLLGIAFLNDKVYLDYTAPDPLRTVVAEYKLNADGTISGISERILLQVEQPASNHNGGHLEIGPDGMLYIALGDGGSAGDPWGNGQNPKTLLGSILRIDPDGEPYGIPKDNPFYGNTNGFREEIFAFGLRNPWKFSFDGNTIWAGDVGQNSYEEIGIIEKGGNHGWNLKEGFECYAVTPCANTSLVDPLYAYGRGMGASVTGGYVYRGNTLNLEGRYIYGDFISGRIWAFSRTTGNIELLDTDLLISSFGLSSDGEIFVVDYRGTIFLLQEK